MLVSQSGFLNIPVFQFLPCSHWIQWQLGYWFQAALQESAHSHMDFPCLGIHLSWCQKISCKNRSHNSGEALLMQPSSSNPTLFTLGLWWKSTTKEDKPLFATCQNAWGEWRLLLQDGELWGLLKSNRKLWRVTMLCLTAESKSPRTKGWLSLKGSSGQIPHTPKKGVWLVAWDKYIWMYFLVSPSMKMTALDYLYIPVLSHPYSTLMIFKEDLLFYSFFHVHCLWTCHCAPLKESIYLAPFLHFTLMRYALSLLFSRLNSLNSHPLLRSTVLRRSLETQECRTSKWWSVWAEAGAELSGCRGGVCLSLKYELKES